MGKQWLLYKVAGHATGTSSSTSNKNTAGKSRKRGGDRHMPFSSSTFGGCMGAVFHLFDIQHHHHHQPSFISESSNKIPQESNIILKGVEAPRNSLELEEQEPMVEEAASSSSSSSKLKQETNFNMPMRDIQIKTKRSRLTEDVSSDCSSSPGSKTPSLVARLMGLDLLPENSSPRPSLSSPRVSSSSSHATPLINPLSKLSSHKYNTHSLPATPRISTTQQPSTEANYHHRLSLQINKENKRRYDESSSEYAKQITKQVRENISRRVGADITNSVKNNEHRRDEFLVLLKPKRSSPPSTAKFVGKSRNLDQVYGCGKENEPMHLSCSPKLRLLDIKNKNIYKPDSNSLKSSPLSSSSETVKTSSSSSSIFTKSPVPLLKDEVQVVKQEKPIKVQKCKRIASEKFDLRLKKMHQQEEPFVKKCSKKSTPLSNHLVKVNNTTKFISFKKDMASTSSATISLQKQVPLASITQLPSCQSRPCNTKDTHKLSTQEELIRTNDNGVTTTGSSVSDHFDYISRILSHTGIEATTPISISHWYSPSHPLHPSIFHQIETPTATNSADRKLIFAVVDELLAEILKPYINLKPWALGPQNSHRMSGSELIGKLCEKIGCFPAADCQVLEDIDGLIEGDMRRITRVVRATAFEEEAEELVSEMEREMVDTLVTEMAEITLHVGSGSRV